MRMCLLAALLLPGLVHAAAVRFAIIGDYGVDTANELAVANLVKTNLGPEFIVTVGDNNYLGADQIDRAIGKYYHEYIGNYVGAYGTGASSNRFFPALGNHDWYEGSGFAAHTNYFTLPGNERYYEIVRGPVHILILNSDPHEPDGTSAASIQGVWLSNRLAASRSPWKLVISQDPPHSSFTGDARMRWPYEQWGATIVLSGHAHSYERIMRDGFPYIINGAGGAALVGFGTPVTGSVVRYAEHHGAMLVVATDAEIAFEFWSVAGGGTLIDRFVQTHAPQVSVSVSNRLARITWPVNGSDGFMLQSASNPAATATWSNVLQEPAVSGSTKVITVTTDNPAQQFFRLRK